MIRRPLEAQVPGDAQTGQMGTSSQMSGNSTYQELTLKPGAPGSGVRYLGLGFPYRSGLPSQKSRTKRKGPVPGTGPHTLVIGCGENDTP
jgi:hypothetical protein